MRGASGGGDEDAVRPPLSCLLLHDGRRTAAGDFTLAAGKQPSADRDPVPPGNPLDPTAGDVLYYANPTSVPPDPSIGRAAVWPAGDQVELVGTEDKAGFQIATIQCEDAADANDDGKVDISDPRKTLDYLFLGGTLPAGTTPGVPQADPTPDGLGCG